MDKFSNFSFTGIFQNSAIWEGKIPINSLNYNTYNFIKNGCDNNVESTSSFTLTCHIFVLQHIYLYLILSNAKIMWLNLYYTQYIFKKLLWWKRIINISLVFPICGISVGIMFKQWMGIPFNFIKNLMKSIINL